MLEKFSSKSLFLFPVMFIAVWGIVACCASSVLAQSKVQPVVDDVEAIDLIQKVTHMGEQGDVPALIEIFKTHPNNLVRTATLFMLGGFKDPTVVEVLSDAIQDPEEGVRITGLQALSYIGGKEAEGLIKRALEDKSPRVAQMVPGALDRLKPGTPVTFSTIDQGLDSGFKEPGHMVITTPTGWKELWTKHKPSKKPPAVDFTKERVIAAFLGEQKSSGAFVRIETIEEKPKFLRVLIQQSPSAPSAPEKEAKPTENTSPYHIIKLTKNVPVPTHMLRRFSPKEK